MHRVLLLGFFLLSLFIGLTISGCGADESSVNGEGASFGYPTKEWPEAAPEDLGMDRSRLEELQYLFEKFTPASLVVTRKGYVVWEKYYRGYSQETQFEVWSVTKSFSSALAGIAVGDGLFSLGQPAADFIDLWRSPDPRSAITIRDILTMSSGLYWYWSEYAHIGLSFPLFPITEDLLQYALNLPLEHTPGTHWTYNNCAVMTLDEIFSKTASISLKDFAMERLFKPIGMNSTDWLTDGHGNTYGFMGIMATARDQARFGYLFLRGGSWEGRQIVPKDWVQLSTKTYKADLNPAYGYLWWVNGFSDHWQYMEGEPPLHLPRNGYFFGDVAPPDSYAATGAFGQMIAVVPELELVMVRNGGSECYSYQDVFTLLCESVIR